VAVAESIALPPSARPALADIALLLEGTYPYVAGGVSSWVHEILRGHPLLGFRLLHIGPQRGVYTRALYQLPPNVLGLDEIYCHAALPQALDVAARAQLESQIRAVRRRARDRKTPSRVLAAFRRLHLEELVDDALIDDLATADLPTAEFLHGRAAFDLISELAEQLAPGASFLDFFWHFRSMHVPILRLLAAPLPEARSYHAVSTGYAGLVGAVASRRKGRPLLVTEHGIYSRERDTELARADWIQDRVPASAGRLSWAPTISPLRRLWSRFFRALSRIAYHQAERIITLSEVNRRKQLADGAPEAKTAIIPNGVDVEGLTAFVQHRAPAPAPVISVRPAALRVGFVGRVVAIKDVLTFIKACDLALRTLELDIRIIGPAEEDPVYAQRCRNLCATLGREQAIRFVGAQPLDQIYPSLDLVVLTSLSEGQPLVMLEAYAAGLPVVATDVGACRELILGRTEDDRALGPSGLVTRMASPAETAAAIVRLARDPALRRAMGEAGRQRVARFYQRRDMLEEYRKLYGEMVRP
jgi:glycosyltransferase involved in cell wall biosynthesis